MHFRLTELKYSVGEVGLYGGGAFLRGVFSYEGYFIMKGFLFKNFRIKSFLTKVFS